MGFFNSFIKKEIFELKLIKGNDPSMGRAVESLLQVQRTVSGKVLNCRKPALF